MTQPTLTTISRPVRPIDVRVAADLLIAHSDLPRPTSYLVELDGDSRVHVTLTIDGASRVDAWAEAMGVDVDHDQHPDGTWTDTATGSLPVPYLRDGRVVSEEQVQVTVYTPLVDAECSRIHPGETADEVADRITRNVELFNGPEVNL